MPIEPLQRQVVYRGRVQGVGFRYTACRLAGGFDVCGFVQNLPDGRVKLVAEGDFDAVRGFLRRVREVLGDYIQDEQVLDAPASGEFDGFAIRY